MVTKFTKKNLKTGMVVEYANGDRNIVIMGATRNTSHAKEGIFLRETGWMPLDNYTNTLEYKFEDSLSVVRVYDYDVYDLGTMLKRPENLIWERSKNNKEYIDWNTVPVDTTILVRDFEDEDWIPAYFAEYKNGVVYVWEDGGTSFTKKQTEAWCYTKLYEEDK